MEGVGKGGRGTHVSMNSIAMSAFHGDVDVDQPWVGAVHCDAVRDTLAGIESQVDSHSTPSPAPPTTTSLSPLLFCTVVIFLDPAISSLNDLFSSSTSRACVRKVRISVSKVSTYCDLRSRWVLFLFQQLATCE